MEERQSANMSILIIDDDFGIRDSLSQLLNDEGFRVTSAADGEEALNFLLQNPNHPCLILLDLMMPGVNGWEFRRQQKQNPMLASIPIAIISADRDLKAHAVALEADEYIDKPIDADVLFQVVGRYCSRY